MCLSEGREQHPEKGNGKERALEGESIRQSPVGLPEGVEGSRVGPAEFWIRVWSHTPAQGTGLVRVGAEVVVRRGEAHNRARVGAKGRRAWVSPWC